MTIDVRWKQRFQNYKKALLTLDDAILLSKTRDLTKLEQQGLIQSFEFTHELAWNLLKDYLDYKGISGLIGSKDATRSAFKNEIITNGEAWMSMIADRNLTSHTYDETTANKIVHNILNSYYTAFTELKANFEIFSQEAE